MDLENLNNWNPWWTSGTVPEVLKGTRRDDLDPLIFKALDVREITALTGIRRGGKTTAMYQMVDLLLAKKFKPSQIVYVNLDDEALKRESLEAVYNAYRQNKNPSEKAFIFLDEIQNVDGWEKFLKKHYDLRDDAKFVVSGSSSGLLKGEYSALLTGRNLTFRISPLSFREYLAFSKITTDAKIATTAVKNRILYELNAFLENGGLPEVFFKEKELKHVLLKQYFDDVIYKDIVSRHNINPKKITELAVYLLTNIANAFTIRKIRNFTGLSIDSIKDYISYLEDAFLIKTTSMFSYSVKESAQLPRKCYALDCGLRNAVCFRFSEDAGRLAENLVFVELERRGMDPYYWKNRGEVDFVIKTRDQSLTAINVSYTDAINDREKNSLLEFKNAFKKANELVVLTKDTEKKEGGISFVPLWKWLLLGDGERSGQTEGFD